MLPNGSSAKFKEFMEMTDEQQRQTISDVSLQSLPFNLFCLRKTRLKSTLDCSLK